MYAAGQRGTKFQYLLYRLCWGGSANCTCTPVHTCTHLYTPVQLTPVVDCSEWRQFYSCGLAARTWEWLQYMLRAGRPREPRETLLSRHRDTAEQGQYMRLAGHVAILPVDCFLWMDTLTELSNEKIKAAVSVSCSPVSAPCSDLRLDWLFTEIDLRDKAEALREPDLNLMTRPEKLMTCWINHCLTRGSVLPCPSARRRFQRTVSPVRMRLPPSLLFSSPRVACWMSR